MHRTGLIAVGLFGLATLPACLGLDQRYEECVERGGCPSAGRGDGGAGESVDGGAGESVDAGAGEPVDGGGGTDGGHTDAGVGPDGGMGDAGCNPPLGQWKSVSFPTLSPPYPGLRAVHGFGSIVFVVGEAGAAYQVDTTSSPPTATPLFSGRPLANFYAVAGSSNTDVWLVGDAVYHYDGMSPVLLTSATASSSNPGRGAWAPAPGVVEIAHNQDLIERMGVTAVPTPIFAGDGGLQFRGYWGSGGVRVATTDNYPLWVRSADGGWSSPLQGAVALNAVHGSAPENVWAVGMDGGAFHYNTTMGVLISRPVGNAEPLSAVHVQSPQAVWAVGKAGTVAFWNGTCWAIVPPPVGAPSLTGVWANQTSAVVVGNNGFLAVYQ